MPTERLNRGPRPRRSGRTRRVRSPLRTRAAVPEHDGRERILAVAIRAFAELGYAGATTAGIARAADVTQPLIHHHFGSKEGLWRAAMEVVFAKIPRLPTAADTVSPRETIMAIAERFIRFVAAQPEATRIVAREGAAPSPRLEYLVERYLDAPFRGVVDVLRAAQSAGTIPSDVRPELCLFLVLGAGSHLFDVSALAARSQGIDTTAPATREAFVALLRTLLEQGLFRRNP